MVKEIEPMALNLSNYPTWSAFSIISEYIQDPLKKNKILLKWNSAENEWTILLNSTKV